MINDINISAINKNASQTELDSHANMPVVGRHCYIINDTGKTADVNAFAPDIKALKIPIVDAAIQYDCPYDGTVYILIVRNALYVKSMSNNLIPPFVMREAGIEVNDTPKIQKNDPGVEDHSIYFPSTNFRIPLSLWGVFSFFPTSKPTEDMVIECEEVYVLTPENWNPHSSAYAANEDSMLDWQGNLVEAKDRRKIIIEDIKESTTMAAPLSIGETEANLVNEIYSNIDKNNIESSLHYIPPSANQVASVLAGIDPNLNDVTLCTRMENMACLSHFKTNIGAVTVSKTGEYILEDDPVEECQDTDTERENESECNEDNEDVTEQFTINSLYQELHAGIEDFDEVFASAAHAGRAQGISAEQLSKVWRINIEDAERTLEVVNQRSLHKTNPSLARNYPTNDRMLRYNRIEQYFFMDTFFATKKAGKSSRGNTCCQLFVTDRGFYICCSHEVKERSFVGSQTVCKGNWCTRSHNIRCCRGTNI